MKFIKNNKENQNLSARLKKRPCIAWIDPCPPERNSLQMYSNQGNSRFL